MTANKPQRGVALIVVLLILAIMVSIAATMSERMFAQFQRASHQVNYQQAYWYSVGVENLAMALLKQTRKQDKDIINLSQPWAIKERTLPLDYGQVSGTMIDKQACFNLNAFNGLDTSSESSTPYVKQVFENLLTNFKVDSATAEIIADSTYEFIDSNDTVSSTYGVEDSYYDSLSPAYLPPNGLMAVPSELRAVQQVSADLMTKLKPYLCAIPVTDWQVNINTLSEKQALLLVAMFSPNLSLQNAQAVIKKRPKKGWESVSDFMAEPQIAAISSTVRSKAQGYLVVDSQYFELDAQITVDNSRVRVRSLIFSEDKDNATVIRRRYGGISERISDRSSE
ncbi:type II secretion system minor pseudopilin GspK [Vibrio nitrifigilis]|uniref:Type II secretion system protein K n=1 Tax=Vibrio nitrifigilis TaxID=2789781 RepID=A0ABS0GHF8_9VIBR|nr:type II secretion system minor pseudopilin GspK [Vibrio nitrifigilis]MBF9001875.1 type II secretion system minor pseudopilin GspK [Vibrio nitrifigilis]